MLAKPEQLFIQDLEGAASRFDGATVVRALTGITIGGSGPGGFDMALMVVDGTFVLTFDHWEETFDNAAVAQDIFEAALNGEARLRIDTLSGRRWRWTLERLDAEDRWVPQSTIGHPVWRFWGKPDVVHLRNVFRRTH